VASESGDIVYSDDFIACLEMLWGEGFLSPGGREEIARMLAGLDLEGAEVLNIGSGLGAMELILARDHGAGKIVGIDIEAPLIARARAAAARAGLADVVSYRLVTPGPLPFPDAAFDVVTSKDAIICVSDKASLFAEAFRTLRPGGALALSDWYGGPPPVSAAMEAWMATAPGHYFMETLDNTARILEGIGFRDVETTDRNAWYLEIARHEVAGLHGANRARLVHMLGEEDARAWTARVEHKTAAVAHGDLRPGHLRARKPG